MARQINISGDEAQYLVELLMHYDTDHAENCEDAIRDAFGMASRAQHLENMGITLAEYRSRSLPGKS